MDAGLPRIGEIVELSSTENPQAKTAKFEIISFDPTTGLIEARACEPNPDGEHTFLRMLLQRIH